MGGPPKVTMRSTCVICGKRCYYKVEQFRALWHHDDYSKDHHVYPEFLFKNRPKGEWVEPFLPFG